MHVAESCGLKNFARSTQESHEPQWVFRCGGTFMAGPVGHGPAGSARFWFARVASLAEPDHTTPTISRGETAQLEVGTRGG